MNILITVNDDTGAIERVHVGHRSAAGTVSYEHIEIAEGAPGKPPTARLRPVPGHVDATVAWAASLLDSARGEHLRSQLVAHGGVAPDQVDDLVAAIAAAREARGRRR